RRNVADRRKGVRRKGGDVIEAIARKETIAVGEVLVDARVYRVAVLRPVGAVDEVVGNPPQVRRRVELEVVERDGADLARVQHGAANIGKVADVLLLEERRHCTGVGDALNDAQTFVVGEEEGLVFADRAAKRATELVLPVLRFTTGAGEEVARVE